MKRERRKHSHFKIKLNRCSTDLRILIYSSVLLKCEAVFVKLNCTTLFDSYIVTLNVFLRFAKCCFSVFTYLACILGTGKISISKPKFAMSF